MERMLKLGDKGDAVTALQAALVGAGLKIDIDGDFGKQTETAVRRLQKAGKIAVDGVVGQSTLELLRPAAPAEVPASVEPAAPVLTGSLFVDGVLTVARQCPAHPTRVGAAITAKGIVVHTTDCGPGTMQGILKRWSLETGEGCAATFMIGRRAATPEELATEQFPSAGLAQMVPIDRNANHAGGSRKVNGSFVPYHGNFEIDGHIVHPNTCTVGIEVDNAGRLIRSHGVWYHTDSGHTFADADVFVDDRGKGWERVTEYQLETLGKLIDALDEQLAHFPEGVKVLPNGDHDKNGVSWAKTTQTRVVAHATLDPNNKTDCGPQIWAFLKARYGI
jgi:hypothetical protein